MAKILEKGDTGFGILIENDAGYVDRKINAKTNINESQLIIEPGKPVIIPAILQKWGVENKNGRIYPEDILKREVERYMEAVSDNAAVNEADHPESSVVSLDNISHIIKEMWWGKGPNDSNVLYGTLEIITSPAYMENGIIGMVGDKIAEYLRRGIKLGISSRGVGTLKETNGKNIVQDDFELICFDLVASPSTPGAYLFPEKSIKMGEGLPKRNVNLNENNNDKVLNAINKFLL
ncbi:MAG: hypothetical protein ACOCV1_06165 [Bacillota bacterium]